MAKHNVVVALGLLCFLAATCTTGRAGDVRQDEFKIEGWVGRLRGMMSMLDASSKETDAVLKAIRSKLDRGAKPTETLEKLKMIRQGLLKRNGECCTDLTTASLVEELIGLADTKKLCTPWQSILFLAANQVVGFPWPTYNTLKTYVNHFGKKKFSMCAEWAIKTLERNDLPKIDEKFDRFFRDLLDLNPTDDNRTLLEKLKATNLLRSTELQFGLTLRLDAVKEAAKRLYNISDKYYYPQHGGDIWAFFYRSCEELRNHTFRRLDWILLSNDAQMISQLNDRLKKLIEYDHVCWYVLKYKEEFIWRVNQNLGLVQ
jgi:hypothetical protein